MAFANINVGNYPSDGTGDPLRTAFIKINDNFANITAGNITVNAPVKSVVGRTGNVILTVNDIIGAVSAANVQQQLFTTSNSANWNGSVSTIAAALDQLALRIHKLGG
jgi:hypothetical protein